MGRPLYTTALLARYATEAIRTEPPKPTYPLVEKWSRWNAFDPDSDEFFESDNAVYEAFLSEEEVAERAQTQQRESARLLAETLLREAEADTSSASSSTTTDSDHPATSSERAGTTRPAVQLEIDVQYDPLVGDRSTHVARDGISRDGGTTEEQQPPRRQPRRSPAIFQWPRDDADIIPPTDVVVPRISVVPVQPVEPVAHAPSRSPSPDPVNLVSGLSHLSESPRPLLPTESSDRAISPIPNTPARVSGVFSPQTADTAANTPSPAPTMTPRILSWGSDVRGQWLPDSPTPAPRAVFRYMDARIPTASAPLTY